MAFQWAYSLDGASNSNVKDLPLDTLALYQTTAGTNPVKKGDLVYQTAGLLRRSFGTTVTSIGVVEGGEFTGLVAAGQPYVAAKASQTDSATNIVTYPNGMAKVRMDKSDVYRIAVKAGQTATNAVLGQTYIVSIDAAGDQTVDITVQTTPSVKVIDRSPDGKTLFVVLL